MEGVKQRLGAASIRDAISRLGQVMWRHAVALPSAAASLVPRGAISILMRSSYQRAPLGSLPTQGYGSQTIVRDHAPATISKSIIYKTRPATTNLRVTRLRTAARWVTGIAVGTSGVRMTQAPASSFSATTSSRASPRHSARSGSSGSITGSGSLRRDWRPGTASTNS